MSKETPEDRYTRLLIEAEAGVDCDVTEAEALEFRREAYLLNARAFARILGLTPPKYSEVINGHRRLPVNAIARAVAIGIPVAPLLAGRGGKRTGTPPPQGERG